MSLRVCQEMADTAFDAWQDAQGRADLGDNVGMGADGTPTSRIDKMLEDAILEVASARAISVLSEEAGFVDHGSPETAIIDPLDGSRNAARGIPFFCTSIAMGVGDLSGINAGVVRNLVTGETYAAETDRGATVDGAVPAGPPFDAKEMVIGLIAEHGDKDVAKLRHHHLRDLGSSALELCLVGTGAIDAFVVREPWLRVIDIAAGVLFVEEAGGVITDPAGAPLATPFSLDVRCGVMAARTPEAMTAIMAEVGA